METSNPSLKKKAFQYPQEALAQGTMTLNGAINKSGFLLVILACAAAYTWSSGGSPTLAMIGAIGGLIAALILIFNPPLAPFLAPVYAALEGLVLGSISFAYETRYPGIAMNAMTLTFAVLAIMLLCYRTGLLRATPIFQKVVIFSTCAIAITYIVDLIMSFFSSGIPMIHSGSPIGIAFSVVVVGIASMNLILDFDLFERNANSSPKYMEWYCGFALLVTLVWLYLEMLNFSEKSIVNKFVNFEMKFAGILIFLMGFSASALDLECYTKMNCGNGGRSSSSSNPSYGSQIRINPSAVPVEKGLGLEGILYDGTVDVALVRGFGRIGAAISPSNSEETFFGPPGLEFPNDYLDRKQNARKFPNQKITLAGAFDLIKRKNSGLKSYGLQMGLMGKYNQLTHNTKPGVGLSGVLGPFIFGGSYYEDETQLDDSLYGGTGTLIYKYQVRTYNIGVSLKSLLLDYSVLKIETSETQEVATVRLITASLLFRKIILTASKRTEDSQRENYNFETKTLEIQPIKEDIFGGLQIYATSHLLVGFLYNYYLLREYSLTATLFF